MTHPARYSIAVAVAASLVMSAAAHAATLTPQEEKLVAAAKQEGAVTFLNPVFADETSEAIGKAFIARYDLGPDFKFNNLRKGTGQTVAQLRQEIKAGKFTVDILMVSAPGFFDEAARRGAFEALDSGYWKDSEELVKKAGRSLRLPLCRRADGLHVPAGVERIVSRYGQDHDQFLRRHRPAGAEGKDHRLRHHQELHLHQYRCRDDGSQGGGLRQIWDELKATDPIVEFRTEAKMQMVVSCQRPFDMWNVGGRVFQNVLKEPKLATALKMGHYKEGQVMLGNQAAVVKGGPHPNAGKLFIEFLLSKEGADIFVEGEGVYTFRKDYTPPAAVKPYLLDLSEEKLVGLNDWVGAQKEFKDVHDAWEKRFK